MSEPTQLASLNKLQPTSLNRVTNLPRLQLINLVLLAVTTPYLRIITEVFCAVACRFSTSTFDSPHSLREGPHFSRLVGVCADINTGHIMIGLGGSLKRCWKRVLLSLRVIVVSGLDSKMRVGVYIFKILLFNIREKS